MSDLDDVLGPYSPETMGDLKEYLRECERKRLDNLFYGEAPFFAIKDLGVIIPEATSVRVDQEFIPDIEYFVNPSFMLESIGTGPHNMSSMEAVRGIYSPDKALKDKIWSISMLNLWDELDPFD